MLYKPLISITNPNTIKTYRIFSNSHSCSFPGFHGAKNRCVSEIRKLAQFLWDFFFPVWKQGGGRVKKKNNLTETSLFLPSQKEAEALSRMAISATAGSSRQGLRCTIISSDKSGIRGFCLQRCLQHFLSQTHYNQIRKDSR